MIACTRMYNVNAVVQGVWRNLLEKVSESAGVALEVIDYPAPAPLADLWTRSDMGCVFMCGWPFFRAMSGLQIVAAPVPRDGTCAGPTYCTDFVVRTDSPFRRLEDTFGGRIAWTDESSHSGFNAPRHHLQDLREGKERLYRESVGPVVTPRASLTTVIEGRADVAPLDSYFHALLRKFEPELAAQIRVVARTECTPIPPLVASADVGAEVVMGFGHELVAASGRGDTRRLLDALCLEEFVQVPNPHVYALTAQWDAEARAGGYPFPA